MLNLIRSAKRKPEVTMNLETVVFRDPNIKKRLLEEENKGQVQTPSFYKFCVKGEPYRGAKNAIHTLLNSCESKPLMEQNLKVNPYGDLIKVIRFIDTTTTTTIINTTDHHSKTCVHRICRCQDTPLEHGTRVDEEISNWCEMLLGELSSDLPDKTLLDDPSDDNGFFDSAMQYFWPDADPCALKTAETCWNTLKVCPMETQFKLYSESMKVATAIDILGTSREDLGNTVVVIECKSSNKMTMRQYMGPCYVNRNGDASIAKSHMIFTSSGSKSFRTAGELLEGMPDNDLTRDLFQVMISMHIINQDYRVPMDKLTGHLIKVCSDGLVIVGIDERLKQTLSLLGMVMTSYEETKKPIRKEGKKQKVLDKYASIKNKLKKT